MTAPAYALAGLASGAVLALVVRARRRGRARPEQRCPPEPVGVDFGPARPGVIRHVRLIGYQPPENE